MKQNLQETGRLAAVTAAAVWFFAAAQAHAAPGACLVDAPSNWTSQADTTSRPDRRIFARTAALAEKDDVVTFSKLEGAKPVQGAPNAQVLFLASPPEAPGGGEYVGVSDGAPPCAAVVIYKNAGDKDLAAFLAASVYARAP